MERGADTEPEQILRVHARARSERARDVGDALAVTLRVLVLRFNRFAPALDDLEEVALEATGHAVEVGDIALRTKLGEHAMRAIELLERFAVASLTAI